MLFLKNIQSVSKYESKLLYRSWFFKVFATLTVVATIFTAIGTLEESRYVESIPTLLGYSLMFTFNIGQAIVSIFLASEYLKRDKQLDTSEIFYVRPLSNAEYLLGKMWGTIRVFLLLNFIVMVVGVVCGYTKLGAAVDIGSFFGYFFNGLNTYFISFCKHYLISYGSFIKHFHNLTTAYVVHRVQLVLVKQAYIFCHTQNLLLFLRQTS